MKVCSIALALALLIIGTPVWAGETTAPSGALEHHFSLGAAGFVMPEFEGADSYTGMAFPLLAYSNQYVFISTMKGAGINAIRTSTFTAGPMASYRFGRKESASDLLDGLGDVDGGLEAGAFLNWQFHERLGTHVKALHGIGDAKGYTVDAGLTYNRPLVTDLSFVLKASAQFADSEYNQQHFGITAKQSQRSGYDRYSAESGIKHVSIQPTLRYTFAENYAVDVFYEYKRLTGPAADSPLVKRGSVHQNMAGVGLTWNY